MSDTPAAELREAATLMRERADAMDAEMNRMPATWEPGWRDEVAASLGGPAGELAAPWGPEANRAVADLLDAMAGIPDPFPLRYPGALTLARRYLGTESKEQADAPH